MQFSMYMRALIVDALVKLAMVLISVVVLLRCIHAIYRIHRFPCRKVPCRKA